MLLFKIPKYEHFYVTETFYNIRCGIFNEDLFPIMKLLLTFINVIYNELYTSFETFNLLTKKKLDILRGMKKDIVKNNKCFAF